MSQPCGCAQCENQELRDQRCCIDRSGGPCVHELEAGHAACDRQEGDREYQRAVSHGKKRRDAAKEADQRECTNTRRAATIRFATLLPAPLNADQKADRQGNSEADKPGFDVGFGTLDGHEVYLVRIDRFGLRLRAGGELGPCWAAA
jgi:hypothetical protein